MTSDLIDELRDDLEWNDAVGDSGFTGRLIGVYKDGRLVAESDKGENSLEPVKGYWRKKGEFRKKLLGGWKLCPMNA